MCNSTKFKGVALETKTNYEIRGGIYGMDMFVVV